MNVDSETTGITHVCLPMIRNAKKRKSQKESVPVSLALYHGIFMLKSNVDTSI
jgi:hypothetical protein